MDDIDALELDDLDEDFSQGKPTSMHTFGRYSGACSIKQQSFWTSRLCSGQNEAVEKQSLEESRSTVQTASQLFDAGTCEGEQGRIRTSSTCGLHGAGDFLASLFSATQGCSQNEDGEMASKDKQDDGYLGIFPNLSQEFLRSDEGPTTGSQQVPVQRKVLSELTDVEEKVERWEKINPSPGDRNNNTIKPPQQGCKSNDQVDHSMSEMRIPGPAGRLQAALQKDIPFSLTTTDCGRRVSTSGRNQVDMAFLSNAWSQAMTQGSLAKHTLQDVRAGNVHERIEQILLFVADMHPNGGGSAYAKLKDPTGSMGGVLHHSTLTSHPTIGPGAVLVLDKVAVFSPCEELHYLCIMPDNVKEVVLENSSDAPQHAFRSVQSILQDASHTLAKRTRQPPQDDRITEAAPSSVSGQHSSGASLSSGHSLISKALTAQCSADHGGASKMRTQPNASSNESAPFLSSLFGNPEKAARGQSTSAAGNERVRWSDIETVGTGDAERLSSETMPPPPPRRAISSYENVDGNQSPGDSKKSETSSQGKGRQLSLDSFFPKKVVSGRGRRAGSRTEGGQGVDRQDMRARDSLFASPTGTREQPVSGLEGGSGNILDMFQEVRESYLTSSQSQKNNSQNSKRGYEQVFQVEEVSLGEALSERKGKASRVDIKPR